MPHQSSKSDVESERVYLLNEYSKPLPVFSAESKPFWDGCQRHELLLQQCDRCHSFWFPPSSMCPDCLSVEWKWTRSCGRGRIHSFVIFQRVYHPGFADDVPYVVAVVELEEGPRLISNIVGCNPQSVQCEMPVELVFENVSREVTLPKFGPKRDTTAVGTLGLEGKQK